MTRSAAMRRTSAILSLFALLSTLPRALAQSAPFAKTPVPLATAPRWGTAWCWTDPKHEAVLPVDDSDMGCSCVGKKCDIVPPWKRQHPAIELMEGTHGSRRGRR